MESKGNGKTQNKKETKKNETLRLSNQEANQITRECLQTALILLMSEKPFEKISITELVKRSGVSRTAFYRNYDSKEAILIEIANVLYEKIRQSLEDPKYIQNPGQWFLDLFTECIKNAQLIHFLIQTNQLTLSNINTTVLHSIFPATHAKGRYSSLAAEGALFYILKEWIDRNMKESPEEMASICTEIFQLKS